MPENVYALYQTISRDDCSVKQARSLIEDYSKTNDFQKVLRNVIYKLSHDLKEIHDMDPNEIEIQRDLADKINVCLEYADEFSKKEEPIKIIFARTRKGNICPLEDLTDIPKEQYDEVWKTITAFIQNGYQFQGKLREIKIHKYKRNLGSNQVRLYGDYLPDGTVYLMAIHIKKDNWSKGSKEFVKKRFITVEEDYKKVCKLAEEGKLNELLLENMPIYEIIKNTLSKEEKAETEYMDIPQIIELHDKLEAEFKTQKVAAKLDKTIEEHEAPKEFETKYTRQLNWEYNFSLLKLYYDTYGTIETMRTTYIAVNPETNEYIINPKNGKTVKLGAWLSRQKAKYKEGTLTEYQINKLASLGFLNLIKPKENIPEDKEPSIISNNVTENNTEEEPLEIFKAIDYYTATRQENPLTMETDFVLSHGVIDSEDTSIVGIYHMYKAIQNSIKYMSPDELQKIYNYINSMNIDIEARKR